MNLAAPASGMNRLSCNPITDIVFRIAFSQRPQPDESFLPGSFDRDLLSLLDLIPCHLQLMEEIFKILRLSGEDPVDLIADMISQFWPLRVVCPLYPLTIWLRFNHG